MRNFKIQTNYFSIEFDSKESFLNFSGEFYTTEDTIETYKPVFEMLDKKFSNPGNYLSLNFKVKECFSHVNSSMFLKILEQSCKYQNEKEGQIEVNWYYHRDDENVFYGGEEFVEIFEGKLNIELIQID